MTPAILNSNMISKPFPGLRPYLQEESEIFFGRGEQISRMIERLENNFFLAVVGSSGSGKSSLVRAGLLPALLKGYLLDTGTDWHFITIRPGDDPYGNLASGCVSEFYQHDVYAGQEDRNKIGFIKAMLESSPRGFLDVVDEAQINERKSVLLLVDQFEEIFRFRTDREQDVSSPQQTPSPINRNNAKAFVKMLLKTVEVCKSSEPKRPIYIVITMRSDFIGHCETIPDLPKEISDSQFLVPLMTRNQMQEAIEKPLKKFGWGVEESLVNTILNDAGSMMDQLPLLQHSLMRTWFKAQERSLNGQTQEKLLTENDYLGSGGLDNALSYHLDEALSRLSDKDQRVAQSLFLSLCEYNNEGQLTRRPVSVSEAAKVADVDFETIYRVVNEFQKDERNFIVVSPKGKPTPDSVLDISHEALLRRWGTLKEWINLEQLFANGYRDYAQRSYNWMKGEGELLSGLDLRAATKWLEGLNNRNEAWGKRYLPEGINASLSAFEDVQKLLEKSRCNEEAKELARKASENRLKRLNGGLWATCTLSVACLVGLYFYNSTFNISQEKLFSLSANNLATSDPENSLIFGLASLQATKREIIPQTDSRIAIKLISSMIVALRAPSKRMFAKAEQGQVWSVLKLSNGDLITGGADGHIIRWNHTQPDKSINIAKTDNQILNLLLLDENTIVSGDSGGKLIYWNPNPQSGKFKEKNSSGMKVKVNVNDTNRGNSAIISMAKLSPTEIVIGTSDGRIMRWNTNGTLISKHETDKKPIRALVPIPNSRSFYSAGDDGIVRYWDNKNFTKKVIKSEDAIKGMVILKSGDLVTGNVYGVVQRWDPTTGQAKGDPRRTDQGSIRSLFILNQNDDIISTATAGTISIWNKNLDLIHGPIGTGQGITYSIVPNAKGFFAVGSSGSIVRWTFQDAGQKKFKGQADSEISSGAILKNGDFITASKNGQLQRWDTKGKKRSPALINTSSVKGLKEITSISELLSGNIVTKSSGGSLLLWNDQLLPISNKNSPREIVAFAEISKGKLLTISKDGALRQWTNDFRAGGEQIDKIKLASDKDKPGNNNLLMLSMKNGDILVGGKGEIFQIKRDLRSPDSANRKPNVFKWKWPEQDVQPSDIKYTYSQESQRKMSKKDVPTPNITSLIELEDGSISATTSEGHAIRINIGLGRATIEKLTDEPLTSMAQYSKNVILIGSKNGNIYAWSNKKDYLRESLFQLQRLSSMVVRSLSGKFAKMTIDEVEPKFNDLALFDKLILDPSMPSLDMLLKHELGDIHAALLVDDTFSVQSLKNHLQILKEACVRIGPKIDRMIKESKNEQKKPDVMEMDSTAYNLDTLLLASRNAKDYCKPLMAKNDLHSKLKL